eukprot:PhF_6_TR40496/c2_g1_i2/m.60591
MNERVLERVLMSPPRDRVPPTTTSPSVDQHGIPISSTTTPDMMTVWAEVQTLQKQVGWLLQRQGTATTATTVVGGGESVSITQAPPPAPADTQQITRLTTELTEAKSEIANLQRKLKDVITDKDAIAKSLAEKLDAALKEIAELKAAPKPSAQPPTTVVGGGGGEWITAYDKLNQKFMLTATKGKAKDFTEAVTQRLIPASFAGKLLQQEVTETAATLLLYEYALHELWNNSKEVFTITRSDFEDEVYKEVRCVVLTKPVCKGDLFWFINIGRSIFRCAAITRVQDLNDILASGTSKVLLQRNERNCTASEEYKGDLPWFVDVTLKPSASNPTAKSLDVVIRLKTRSDLEDNIAVYETTFVVPPTPEEGCPQPNVNIPPPTLKSGTEVSETTLIADPKKYTLPPGSSTGPVVEDVARTATPKDPSSSLLGTGHQLQVIPLQQITAYQPMSSRDGGFNNSFTCTARVENASQDVKGLSTTNVEMAYFDPVANAWVPFVTSKEVLSIVHDGWNGNEDHEYINNEAMTILKVPKATQIRIGITGHVQVIGEPGRYNWLRTRAHQSLPVPLDIRVTLSEEGGAAKHILEYRFINKPLDLPTPTSVMSSWSLESPLITFVAADNAQLEERGYVGVYVTKEGMVVRPHSGTYYTLTPSEYARLAYVAKKQNVSELEIEYMAQQNEDVAMRVTALVDVSVPFMWGLKIEVKTPTSSAIGYCHVYPASPA